MKRCMTKRLYLDRKLIVLNVSKYIKINNPILYESYRYFCFFVVDRNPFVDKQFMIISNQYVFVCYS